MLLLLDGYPTVGWNASIVSTFRDVAAAVVVFSTNDIQQVSIIDRKTTSQPLRARRELVIDHLSL